MPKLLARQRLPETDKIQEPVLKSQVRLQFMTDPESFRNITYFKNRFHR